MHFFESTCVIEHANLYIQYIQFACASVIYIALYLEEWIEPAFYNSDLYTYAVQRETRQTVSLLSLWPI